MKLLKLVLIFVSTCFINFNCKKELNETTPAPSSVADEYYVKYVVQSKTIYITTRFAEIKRENNSSATFSFDGSSWPTTIGTVSKGFNARVKSGYNIPNIENSSIDAFIHVSKNNGPFALKKFDQSSNNRTLVEINYIIDF
jgi:hypothetical protein